MKNPRDAKMRLAFEITKIFHGEKLAKKAEQGFIKIIQKKEIPDKIKEFKISKTINISEILYKSGIAKSKSNAKRLIDQGGIKIDGRVARKDVKIDNNSILQKGKREFLKIKYEKKNSIYN